MIDSWMTVVAKGKANVGARSSRRGCLLRSVCPEQVDPASLPWPALRVLIKQAIYGGRVDSDWDQRALDFFVDAIFTPSAFEVGFPLVRGGPEGGPLAIAEGSRLDNFVAWAEQLPEREPPHWLSLPPDAEALILTSQGA